MENFLSRFRYLLPVTLLLACLVYSSNAQEPTPLSPVELEGNVCTDSRSCGECIAVDPTCGWCSERGYEEENGYPRCDVIANLRNRECLNITFPEKSLRIEKNLPLSNAGDGGSGDAVQIAPQEVTLKLRPGESIDLTLSVRQAEDYPVDLYYVMDLSYSMEDDLVNLKGLAVTLAQEIGNITRNFRLGFGSFVEKTLAPFVNTAPYALNAPCPGCLPAYNFRNHLPLDVNTDLFSERVNEAAVSGNLDRPEAGLDALMQITVCTDQIGWHPRARHLVVYTSDFDFHFAGDGKLCGVVQPNDGVCHLNPDTGYNDKANDYDYPSIGHLNFRMRQHNIIPIFAVTQTQETLYKNMAQFIEGSTVGTLAADSSNVIQLIKDNYAKITSRVEISDNAPENLALTYTARCLEEPPIVGSQLCSSLRLGETVYFDISIQATACSADNTPQRFSIGPIGFEETVEITVQVDCSCDCEASAIANSDYCSDGNGTMSCGQCSCDLGRYGQLCECSSEDNIGTIFRDKYENVASCRAGANSTISCSGRGECICGECVCFKRPNKNEIISGRYCECDNFSCERDIDDAICGGPERGVCSCDEKNRRNVCKCKPGYSGYACDCPLATNKCIASNGLTCNLKGACLCNQCVCDLSSPFKGDTCETCNTCIGQCKSYQPCVECKEFGYTTSITQEECDICNVDVRVVDELPKDNVSSLCVLPGGMSNCSTTYTFVYETLDSGRILVHLQAPPDCPDINPGGGGGGVDGGGGEPVVVEATSSQLLFLVIGIVMAIVLIGVALLVLLRIGTYLHDKREFSKFEKEQALAVWDKTQNPIYKPSTSTYVNPLYGK